MLELPGTPDKLETLTMRNHDVFELLGYGMTAKQIATRLHISVTAVERHKSTIRQKLGVYHRSDLIALHRSYGQQPAAAAIEGPVRHVAPAQGSTRLPALASGPGRTPPDLLSGLAIGATVVVAIAVWRTMIR